MQSVAWEESFRRIINYYYIDVTYYAEAKQKLGESKKHKFVGKFNADSIAAFVRIYDFLNSTAQRERSLRW